VAAALLSIRSHSAVYAQGARSATRAETSYRSKVDAQSYFVRGADGEVRRSTARARQEWQRERFGGNPPADLAGRLMRELTKQQQRYPGQVAGAKPAAGVPQWEFIGPNRDTKVQNGVTLNVVDGLPYTHADFHAAAFTNIGGKPTVFFGTDGGLSVSRDGGASWDDTKNRGLATHLIYALATSGVDRSTVLIGLQDNGTRFRRGISKVYNQTFGGDGFGTGWSQANGKIAVGSLYFSYIFYSDQKPNDQSKWQQPTGDPSNFCLASGIDTCNANFVTSIATPTAAADSTGLVFFTNTKDYLYRTTDGAASWKPIFVGEPDNPDKDYFRPAQHVTGVHHTDLNRIAAVALEGFVRITTDGGKTWRAQDIKIPGYEGYNANIAWAGDETLYVASENPYGDQTVYVLKSTDTGRTWKPAASGLPLVPVTKLLVSPRDPSGNTLYAATWIGVYQTTDGGAHWRLFGAGLPAVQVSDLYLPADGSFLRVSTYGRGIWQVAL
jgi:photosystem II stability/assembly factor-like uncharacterized protein